MSEKVIEPSEIVIEQPHKPRENITHANPWIRLLARGVDYSLFFCLLLSSRHFFHGKVPLGDYEHLVPFEFFLWIPLEALLLKVWGTTPGKFFLKTKLKQGKKTQFPYMTALKRSFSVWFRGMGMGIPFVNFFCLLVAYNRLKLRQTTSWDLDDHFTVTHYPIGRWRIYVAILIALAGSFYYYSEKNRDLKKEAHHIVHSNSETAPHFPYLT